VTRQHAGHRPGCCSRYSTGPPRATSVRPPQPHGDLCRRPLLLAVAERQVNRVIERSRTHVLRRSTTVTRAAPANRIGIVPLSSQTGPDVSRTLPFRLKNRYRSKDWANQRSCVTASTVPSYASRPSWRASADSRSRLSVGSSSKSSVAPWSSSCSIWKRACCPPDSLSKRWSPCRSSSYRRSTLMAAPRSRACSVHSTSTKVRLVNSGRACVWAK